MYQYLTNYDELKSLGFKKNNPHIKTNLYTFDKHYDLFKKNKVSISGSVDLPLKLHDKYRTTKTGKSSLPKIEKNIKLLSNYPHNTKLSATLFGEHLKDVDQIIEDIWYIHNELNFDMNNFNFMFGFESSLNDEKYENNSDSLQTDSISDHDQVIFYHRMKEAFMGTELEWGFKENWFDEFTPKYCTNSSNCGDKFFLLQSNGDVYSCVRGQGTPEFYYGNIFRDTAHDILNNGRNKIQTIHQQYKLDDDCKNCDYLHICNTGCAFVKSQQNSAKSYTCALQKEIYKDYPNQYPPVENDTAKSINLKNYITENHPYMVNQFENIQSDDTIKLPNDFYQEDNTLGNIIKNDLNLIELYSSDNFLLTIDNEPFTLTSQILKTNRSILWIDEDNEVFIHVRKSIFQINCDDDSTNSLYVQLLRDTKVTYGDEQREKQEHIANQQIYMNQLEPSEKGDDWLKLNLSSYLKIWSNHFIDDVNNNLFITTTSLREYHYKKQKMNAFYHIQAINLPFQNFEFIWIT